MQIYCLNDDRGLAGFTHTVSEDKIQRSCVSADVFDQKGISKKSKSARV